ncbi:hypothetical protein FRC02_000082 [Tulasnella sp. 418]|nr:hypothetical protein FRC02_000082 [Tulasnella sp. 418]
MTLSSARLAKISKHMGPALMNAETRRGVSTASSSEQEAPVLFRSDNNCRTYILNQPKKLNALDLPMIRLIKSKIEDWEKSSLCHVIIGTGNGRAFCAGGDVKGIVTNIKAGHPELATQFFKEEFELDYQLASLNKPYVAILDGITMGGGVGLSINAPFRIATENTVFAMPETKIGYSPDVGASFFLPRLDGYLGRYLALTGNEVRGREVFEIGIATHYVPSNRIPALLEKLRGLEAPSHETIDRILDESYAERLPEDPSRTLAGSRRAAIDSIFAYDTVEEIMTALQVLASDTTDSQATWAKETLEALESRSPTSLRVALEAMQRGESLELDQALKMELEIATAYCSGASQDFVTGVTAVLVDKEKGTPSWSPSGLDEISHAQVLTSFFDSASPFLQNTPSATFSNNNDKATSSVKMDPMAYSLPSEVELRQIIQGSHQFSASTAYNLDDLIGRFRQLRPKHGVEEKIREVVARKCELVPATEQQQAYLQWKV